MRSRRGLVKRNGQLKVVGKSCDYGDERPFSRSDVIFPRTGSELSGVRFFGRLFCRLKEKRRKKF